MIVTPPHYFPSCSLLMNKNSILSNHHVSCCEDGETMFTAGLYNLIQIKEKSRSYHSRPRPPPVGSLRENHTVISPEHTLFQVTASRKTHFPATPKIGNISHDALSAIEYISFMEQFISVLFTLQGLVGVVVGGVVVVGEISSLNTHSLEKEMSSRATRPLGPSPCSYLKTIWRIRGKNS